MLSVSNGSNYVIKNSIGAPSYHSEQPWFVLNAAKHYDLVMQDDPAIAHFYSFEADQSNGLTFAIPDGCIDILFDCDPSAPSVKACGSTLEARNADLQHKHRYFGVRFAPSITPDSMSASATELVNHELNMLDLVPGSEPVFAQIVECSDFMDQVMLFRHFYGGRPPRKASELTSEAVRQICLRNGDMRISELEALTCYSHRTLQRQFRNDLGMSPKAFSRIIRCQSAVHNLNYRNNVNFSELACDLGFSDQPHFLREFKKLVSTTPAEYQRQIQQCAYQQRIRQS